MIRFTPWGAAASDLVTKPVGRRSARVLTRFDGNPRSPAFWFSLWAAVAALELAALAPAVLGEEPARGSRFVFRWIGGSCAACGLIAWHRRPDSRSGPLMVATGVGLFVEPVFGQFHSPTLQTVGEMLEDVWGIAIIALLLTTVTGGRLTTTTDRVLVGAFVLQLGIELTRHLFLEQDGNFLLVRADAGIARAINEVNLWLASVSCLAVAAVIGARWKAGSRPRRRALLPSVAGISALLFFAAVQQADPLLVKWLAVCSLLLVPAAFLARLPRSKLARGGLAALVPALRTMRGPQLEAALARTLGDPGLLVASRVPNRAASLRADGAAVTMPVAGEDRRIVPVEHNGREIAALVYDASLDDDPELVEAVSAAAGIALENEHMHAEAHARLEALRTSRERLVAAGDAERKRLERNLHDGAQQRLVALSMQLRLLQGHIREDPTAAEQLVDTAAVELAQSLDELRELARGIHPAVLDHGLDAALESLAARSPVPAAVSFAAGDRLPPPVELAVYFVASEALTNVAKYANATSVSVRVARTGLRAIIEVADDGCGGANLNGGSGLRGLADRVEALDGRLQVVSPRGAGTIVTAEVPCGS